MSTDRQVRTVVVVRPPLGPVEIASPLDLVRVERDGDGNCTLQCEDKKFSFPAIYGHSVGGLDLDALGPSEIEPLLQGCLSGESSAILAYGQTGAGKSYLCGTECKASKPWSGSVGVYLAHRIWRAAAEQNIHDLEVACQMTEIYREGSSKETVYDLLAGYTRCALQGYAEAKAHPVASSEALLEKLMEGSALRNTDATGGNFRSSRSHAIFTVRLRYTRREAALMGQQSLVTGRLLLVDLAGAEAASEAAPGTQLQRQGAGINVGLSALQLVIREVAEKGSTHHYRLSKLTYLLRAALGAKEGCNAVFVGCISPLLADSTRSIHTLQYMEKARHIRNSVFREVQALEAQRETALQREIERLQEHNALLAAELAAARDSPSTPQMKKTSQGDAEVVVLPLQEHQELLIELARHRDRCEALEVVLTRDQGRFAAMQQQLKCAKERLLVLENGQPGEEQSYAGIYANAGAPSVSMPEGFSLQTPGTASPALVALSLTPILQAADDVRRTEILCNRASTPVDDHAEEFELSLDDICLPVHDSYLAPDQLDVLQRVVQPHLSALYSEPSRRREAQVTALRMAVNAYNGCLGDMATALAEAREREAEAVALANQAAREKVAYVELVAKLHQALDISQHDVVELSTELRESQQSFAPRGHSSPGHLLTGLIDRVLSRRRSSTKPSTSPPHGIGPREAGTPPSLINALGPNVSEAVAGSSAHNVANQDYGGHRHEGNPRIRGGEGGNIEKAAITADNPSARREETVQGPSPFPLSELSDEEDEGAVLTSHEETIEARSDDHPRERRRALVQNAVVASTRQERELQRRMDGGIDVAAITSVRNVSQDYRSSNKHWRGGL